MRLGSALSASANALTASNPLDNKAHDRQRATTFSFIHHSRNIKQRPNARAALRPRNAASSVLRAHRIAVILQTIAIDYTRSDRVSAHRISRVTRFAVLAAVACGAAHGQQPAALPAETSDVAVLSPAGPHRVLVQGDLGSNGANVIDA